MNIYEYFDEEYATIMSSIDNASSLIVQSKEIFTSLNTMQKEILYLLMSFKLNTQSVDKTLEILERILSQSRSLVATTEKLTTILEKQTSY